MSRVWSEEEIRRLGVKTNVETAASIFGVSSRWAYEAIRNDEFPVPVLRVGRKLYVPTAPIRRALGIDPTPNSTEAAPSSAAPIESDDPEEELRREPPYQVKALR